MMRFLFGFLIGCGNTRVNLIYLLKLVLVFSAIAKGSTQGHSNRCTSKETCGECIAEGPSCGWCTQEDSKQQDLPRCDLIENLAYHCKNNTENPAGSMKILMNEHFSYTGASDDEAIQIKPQEIHLRIRPNSPVTFNVEFRQAVDYPVDLYYLMDLSNSMADDKLKLAYLGDKLAEDMGKITKNFRLGFGSFVDKVAAPFVSIHPERLKKPCEDCAAPYGFQNNMPLSLDTKRFAEKVRQSKVSGNLDAPEGAFDAIMQAVVCKKEIGWRNKSRKLLVLSTDNGFHYAGDGKLAGIVEPNDGNCHLDSQGTYNMTAVQDYPSLSQINNKIKENKVNIIFAVTKDQVELYERLSSRFVGSSTGKLDDDSSNVVQLVRTKYNEITSSVEMIDSSSDMKNVHVTYHSKCLGNKKQKTNICTGLKVGTNVSFEVTVEVSFCPKNQKSEQRLEIYPVGINEQLVVYLELICECNCEKSSKEEKQSPKCNLNGTFECGACSCYDNNYGKTCECDSRDNDPSSMEQGCTSGADSEVCSRQGDCRCGKCDCFKRVRPEERIYGTFCECDNFSCDRKHGKLCNGRDHGICDCGKCKCLKGWTGKDCSCKESTENCIDYSGKICSGRGSCVCGSCHCDDSSEQEYFGKFCDDCIACPGKCKELSPCVECFITNNSTKNANCSACNVVIIDVDTIKVTSNETAKPCTFDDQQACRINFNYTLNGENQPIVYAKKETECPIPVNTMAIVSGASGSIVGAGLLLLFLWKLCTTIHDRRELAKFEKEREKAQWDAGENPIYKQATSTFQNPAYGGDGGSGDD